MQAFSSAKKDSCEQLQRSLYTCTCLMQHVQLNFAWGPLHWDKCLVLLEVHVDIRKY